MRCRSRCEPRHSLIPVHGRAWLLLLLLLLLLQEADLILRALGLHCCRHALLLQLKPLPLTLHFPFQWTAAKRHQQVPTCRAIYDLSTHAHFYGHADVYG